MKALQELRESCALPFDQARSMPASVYTCEDFHALERHAIFEHEWICAGRSSSLSQPGDYLTITIAGQPILILRDREGVLQAFSNVCLHRLSTLLEGRGQCQQIVCPYHGWVYDLGGQLRAAPLMQHSPACDKREYRLPSIRLEEWLGWIYVTLNSEAEAVGNTLASLREKIDDYQMEGYIETFREEHVWDTNWKILAENFMESYHLPVLHKNTVGGHSSLDDMDCPPGEPGYNYHWIRKEATLAIGNAHPDNTRLEGDWRQTTALIAIYPSHLITLTPGYFWYLSLQPIGVDKVHILFGGGLSPEFVNDPDAQHAIEDLKVLLDEVNREDRKGTEAVFRGAQASLARAGHLCYLERPNYDFAQYLLRVIESSMETDT